MAEVFFCVCMLALYTLFYSLALSLSLVSYSLHLVRSRLLLVVAAFFSLPLRIFLLLSYLCCDVRISS